jgi:hypothetical protein
MKIFTIPFLGFILIGCIQKVEPEQNFGEEVSQSSIEEAMNLASPQHPADMLVGEFVFSELSAQVEGGSPFVAGQRAITITGREDHSDHVLFSFVEEVSELKNGELVSSSKEYVTKVNLSQSPQSYGFSDPYELISQSRVSRSQVFRSQVSQNQKSQNRVTYHSFTSKEVFWPVPRWVRERPHCGGLGDQMCAQGIPARQFTYSKVTWVGPTGTKQDFVVVLSAVTPFLASQLMICVEGFVPFQGQRVRLTQCDETKDFKFGSLPNTSSDDSIEPAHLANF